MKRIAHIELGERACRQLVMENTGSPRRRIWWIVSADVLTTCGLAA